MKIVAVFAGALVVGIAFANDMNRWSVQYRVASGWSREPGMRVWSDGRTAVCTDATCQDIRSCKRVNLDAGEIEEIQRLLVIASEIVPSFGHYQYADRCDDENEHTLWIWTDEQHRTINVTTQSECYTEFEPAPWLRDLTRILSGIQKNVGLCPSDA